MKRTLLRIGLVLIILGIVAALVTSFFMGSIVKNAVERTGSSLAQVDVKVDRANLRMFTGSGELKGLVVGNPEGFKSPSAIQVESVQVDVIPRSIFADKVIVKSIKVAAPEVTFEGTLQGNNLSKLLDNIRESGRKESTGGATASESASRKIQVDDLLISGGKLHLSVELLGVGKSASVPLPEIRLTALGQGPEGITAAEFAEKLLRTLLESATKVVSTELSSLGKNLGKSAQAIGTGTVQQVEKVTKGLGDLLKPK